jgi:hypothetical protein
MSPLSPPPSAKDLTRARRRVDAAAAMAALAWASLAARSWERLEVPVGFVLGVLAMGWLATSVAVRAVNGPLGSTVVRRIVAWGVVFRLLGVLADPVLDDDWARFLWDGFQFARSGDPYARAPIEHFAEPGLPARFVAILSHVNHPDVPSIYPPLCQYAFLLAHAVSPGVLWPLKLLLVAADLGTLALIARVAAAGGVALYAWAPLAIHETAFNAHPDVLGIALLAAAAVAAGAERRVLAATLAGLAMAAKGAAILLVPLLLGGSARAGLALVVAVAAAYLPLLARGSDVGWAATGTFLAGWEFNSLGFAVTSALLGAVAAMAAPWIAVAWAWWRTAGARFPRGDLVFGAFLFFAPVVNPWYLLWLLPFVARWPSPAGCAALAAVSLSYLHGLYWSPGVLRPYEHPWWVRPLEVGIVAAAALGGRRSRQKTNVATPP